MYGVVVSMVRSIRKALGALAMCLTSSVFSTTSALAQIGQPPPPSANPPAALQPEIVVREGHTAKIRIAVFSPDERLLATGSQDSLVKLWDVTTGRLLRTFPAHDRVVTLVAFSPDGRRLATGGNLERVLKLWDIDSGALLREITGLATDKVRSLAFFPDGKRVAIGTASEKGTGLTASVVVLDVETGREALRLEGTIDQHEAIAISGDGQRVAAVGGKGTMPNRQRTVHIWDAGTGRLISRDDTAKDDSVRDLAFTADGARLVLATASSIVQIDAASLRDIARFAVPTGYYATASLTREARQLATAGSASGTVAQLWDIATGKPVTSVAKGAIDGDWNADAIAVSPSGRLLARSSHNEIGLIDAASGRLLRTIKGGVDRNTDIAMTATGDRIAFLGGEGAVYHWDTVAGRVSAWRLPKNSSGGVGDMSLSADGNRVAYRAFGEGGGIRIWQPGANKHATLAADQATHFLQGHFSGDGRWIADQPMAISPDGRRFVTTADAVNRWDADTGAQMPGFNAPAIAPSSPPAAQPKRDTTTKQRGKRGGPEVVAEVPAIRLFDATNGQVLKVLAPPARGPSAFSFSRDGRWLVGGTIGRGKYRDGDGLVTLWDLDSGRIIWSIDGHADGLVHLGFAPDGLSVLTAGWDGKVRLWEPATGRQLRTYDSGNAVVTAAAMAPDGNVIASASGQFPSRGAPFNQDPTARVDLWQPASGRGLCALVGHRHWITQIRFSADGRRIFTSSRDGTVKVWAANGCALLATLYTRGDGEWLLITPEGFFDTSSPAGADLLSVVRGRAVIGIDQVFQSLFNPDLVREKLSLDLDREVKTAAAQLDLGRVLDSGSAPDVTLVSPQGGAVSDREVITAEARIADTGGGVGRIEWRLNGITVGIDLLGAAPEPQRVLRRDIALESGANVLEVAAYNSRNQLASVTARATLTWRPSPAQATPRPKLYAIVLGINAYEDALFRALSYARRDAETFGEALKRAGREQYDSVEVTFLLDQDATIAGLERAFDEIGRQMHPRDAFVFFAAGHGRAVDGRFHIVPQDFRSGEGAASDLRIADRSLLARGIGQDRLQNWIANKIPARSGVILLDACESGAVVATRQTASGLPSGSSGSGQKGAEAALGRLHEATGRPVLTAAGATQEALEGYRGHGVFTYAVLEALVKGDINGNDLIELGELASYVRAAVPRIAKLVPGYADFQQRPHLGSVHGEDFAVLRRLASHPSVPTTP